MHLLTPNLITATTYLQDDSREIQLKNYRMQSLFLKESLRKLIVEETKKRKLEPLTPTARANIKHSLAPNQINIKFHIEDLFNSVHITRYIIYLKNWEQCLRRYLHCPQQQNEINYICVLLTLGQVLKFLNNIFTYKNRK